MTRLELILAALVLSVATGALGSIGGYIYGKNSEEHKRLKTQEVAEAVARAARQSTAEEIAKIKITNKTVNQKVLHEITEKTVYSDCRLPASGVQRANEAITGLLSGDGELPKTDNDSTR